MYTSLETWYPALGKEAELLALCTEFVTTHQARGERYALFTHLYNPVGTAITFARQFGSLAEVDAARATNAADPDFQAARAHATTLSRAPAIGRLRENLIRASDLPDAKYIQTTRIYPVLGHLGAVQSLLTEWAQGAHAQRNIGVAIDMYDPEGQVVFVTGTHASLQSIEERRNADRSDHDFLMLAAELSKLTRNPPVWGLIAVVVGFPPQ